jgi:hypothetical protein
MQRADYEQAVEAARRWIAEHGRYPQQQEWEHWAPGRPTARTIKRRWGWEQLMQGAVGQVAWGRSVTPARPTDWNSCARCDLAHEELGRWSTAGEWEASTSEHVSRRSYVRAFGSWRRACRTAGRLRLPP